MPAHKGGAFLDFTPYRVESYTVSVSSAYGRGMENPLPFPAKSDLRPARTPDELPGISRPFVFPFQQAGRSEGIPVGAFPGEGGCRRVPPPLPCRAFRCPIGRGRGSAVLASRCLPVCPRIPRRILSNFPRNALESAHEFRQLRQWKAKAKSKFQRFSTIYLHLKKEIVRWIEIHQSTPCSFGTLRLPIGA